MAIWIQHGEKYPDGELAIYDSVHLGADGKDGSYLFPEGKSEIFGVGYVVFGPDGARVHLGPNARCRVDSAGENNNINIFSYTTEPESLILDITGNQCVDFEVNTPHPMDPTKSRMEATRINQFVVA